MLDELSFAELLISYLRVENVTRFRKEQLEEIVVSENAALEHIVTMAVKVFPRYVEENRYGSYDITMDLKQAEAIISEYGEPEFVHQIILKYVNSLPGAISPKQFVTLLIALNAVSLKDKYISAMSKNYITRLIRAFNEKPSLYEYERFLPYEEIDGVRYSVLISKKYIEELLKEFTDMSLFVPQTNNNYYFELSQERYDQIIGSFDNDTIELAKEIIDMVNGIEVKKHIR